MLCGKIDAFVLLIGSRPALRLAFGPPAVEAAIPRCGIASEAGGRIRGLQSSDRRLQGSETARLAPDLVVDAGLFRLPSKPWPLPFALGIRSALY